MNKIFYLTVWKIAVVVTTYFCRQEVQGVFWISKEFLVLFYTSEWQFRKSKVIVLIFDSSWPFLSNYEYGTQNISKALMSIPIIFIIYTGEKSLRINHLTISTNYCLVFMIKGSLAERKYDLVFVHTPEVLMKKRFFHQNWFGNLQLVFHYSLSN